MTATIAPLHRISPEEADFMPVSFCDPHGRIFQWRGGIYRAMTDAGVAIYHILRETGLLPRLVERGLLIETDATDLSVDGYGLILEHRRLPFVSYCHEWCGPMLKDAALLCVNLELELARHGLTLDDPNPWNVLFEGPCPVYVDLGSIVPAQEDPNNPWNGYGHFFRTYFQGPLLLASRGHGRIARAMLRDYDHGVTERELAAFCATPVGGDSRWPAHLGRAAETVKHSVKRPLRALVRRLMRLRRSDRTDCAAAACRQRLNYLQHLLREVEDIPLPVAEPMDDSPTLPLMPSAAADCPVLRKAVKELCPASVIDLAGQSGSGALLAAELGVKAISLDAHEVPVARCYHEARRRRLSVLPLVVNIRYPSPASGIGNCEYPPATQRLRCELAWAGEILPSLVFLRELHFTQAISMLAAFCSKWLLVGFVEPTAAEAQSGGRLKLQKCPWYTRDNFLAALAAEFRGVCSYGSPAPGTGVEWLLCER